MFNYITQNKKLFYLTLLTAPIAVGFDIGLAWLLRIITDAGTNGEEQLLPRLILISVLYIIFASISDLLYRKSVRLSCMNLRKTQKSLKEPFKARSALFRTRTA